MTATLVNDRDSAVSPFTALRDQIPLLREVAYFQTGSLAPLAECVRDATVQMLDAEGTSALAGPSAYGALHERSEEHRARLATFLGVRAVEIGWVPNTTTAIRHAIDSLVWQPGDTLITTNREHISTRNLQEGLWQRREVTVAVVDASSGDDRLLSELDRALREARSPRLVLISHVSCQDGRILPAVEAIRLAHAREVPVLVDGAQSLGQFPVDLGALGSDMLVGSAHKWLLGPAGLGFLHVAPGSLLSFDAPFAMAPLGNTPKLVAAGIELGTGSMAARAGLAAALDLLDSIGLANIQNRVAQLTAQLRNGLTSLPGITLLSPEDPGRSSGITSFAVDTSDHARLTEIVAALWASDRVMAKVQVEHPSIRISIAAFNNEDDVSRLIEGLRAALSNH